MRRFIFGWSESFFFAGRAFRRLSETRNLAPRVRSGEEECKMSSGIDNFARDAAAIVPNFINSEYAHQRALRPSLPEKMNEAKEDHGEKEGARE